MAANKIKMSRGDRVFLTIDYILVAFALLIVLYPLIYMLSASVSSPSAVYSGEVILLPKQITLSGYRRVFQDDSIMTGYANTIFYTVAGTLLNLAVTIPCAYALSRRDLPGRGGFMVIFMFTMYFSGGLIPAYLNVKSLGLLNTRAIMLINGLVSTYNVIVSRTFFGSTIPWEMHEAARVDGANDARTFLSIILPLSKPILATLSLFYAVGRWNAYADAKYYITTKSLQPLQYLLSNMVLNSGNDAISLSESAAADTTPEVLQAATIMFATLPIIMVYPFVQKYFVKGTMIGAVKG